MLIKILLSFILIIFFSGNSWAILWPYTKTMSFPTDTVTISGNITQFPHIIYIDSNSWSDATERSNFFGDWNVDGKRVVFLDKDGNELDYEVVSYDATNEIAEYAVSSSSLVTYASDDGTNNYIKVCFGADVTGEDQDNETGVWDSNFKLVVHMDDLTTSTVKDSTGNNTISKKSVNEPIEASGQVGMGQTFDGNDDYMVIPHHTSLNFNYNSPHTVSVFLENYLQNSDVVILNKRDSASAYIGYIFNIPASSYKLMYYLRKDASNYIYRLGNTALSDTNDYHVAVTYNGTAAYTNIHFYLNGASDDGSGVTTGTLNSMQNTVDMNVGKYFTTQFLKATMDELRISNTVRSADWEKLEYYSMKKTSWPGDNWYSWASAVAVSVPTTISTGGIATSLSGNSRKIVRDSDGGYHSVYLKNDGSYNQVYYATTTALGWVETQLTTSSNTKTSPSIAVHSSDSIAVIWIENLLGTNHVRGNRFAYGSWLGEENITYSINNKSAPYLTVDKFGKFRFTFLEASGADVLVKVQFFGTANWQGQEFNLTSSGIAYSAPSITVDNNNYTWVAWIQTLSPSYPDVLVRSIDENGNLGSVEDVTNSGYNKYNTQIAVDRYNNLYCVWDGYGSGYTAKRNIWYSRKPYGGSWSTPINITPDTSYNQQDPSILVTKNGIVHVVFEGDVSGSSYSQIRHVTVIDDIAGDIETLTSASADQISPKLLWSNFPRAVYAFRRYSGNPIISATGGDPDYRLQASPKVIYHNSLYKLYYYGRPTEDGENKIIYTASSDGMTGWSAKAIALSKAVGEWDDVGVYEPVVVYNGSTCLLFYTGGDSSDLTTYAIGLATDATCTNSYTRITDGIDGTSKVLESSEGEWDDPDNGINPASAIVVGSSIYLYYWSGCNNCGFVAIGLAICDLNGKNCTKVSTGIDGTSKVLEHSPHAGDWDYFAVGRCSVFYYNGKYHMFHRGDRLSGYEGSNTQAGYAYSDDGINWIKHINSPVAPFGFAYWEDGYNPGYTWVWQGGDSGNKGFLYFQGAYSAEAASGDPTNRIGLFIPKVKDVWASPILSPDVPLEGYALVYLDDSTITFMESDNLNWSEQGQLGDSKLMNILW